MDVTFDIVSIHEHVVVNNLEDAHELIDTATSTALKGIKPVYISVSCNLPAIPHPTFSRDPVLLALSPMFSHKQERQRDPAAAEKLDEREILGMSGFDSYGGRRWRGTGENGGGRGGRPVIAGVEQGPERIYGAPKSAQGCYESIVSLGDSIADTGNQLLLRPADNPSVAARPPYGRTYFQRPTGRFSDGRLVIDFIAQSLGLPLVQPYVGGGEINGGRSFRKGVNFAVAAASALDNSFYENMGIYNKETNVSLGTQLDWLKHFLATIPDGKKYLQRSLVLMGEIGGNDYNNPIIQGANLEMLRSLVPLVVDYIGSSIQELIKLGAETMLVPGNFPIGCVPVYLTQFKALSTGKDYDPKTGCLVWLNKFSRYHNKMLRKELNRIQQLNPHVALIYADYYNAALRFYLSPNKFGFTKGILRACCGAGGVYNYNASAYCGDPQTTCCDDPSLFASWDGLHFTEAAYKSITQALLQGPYTIPQLRTICPSISWADRVYEL
ncbi:GDSL esterase/lipase at1g31550 [Phtheirospermum japonicum]|uniref:GDSL esterase/lipase at1g31550 n=1 Tax=Phtheirospermum japonicum TaxID=374723 RepID=A0A830CLE6_9LAMI|nr:GDSL esterase/lipase at1g31550 [Phtheirospermum japonicum]